MKNLLFVLVSLCPLAASADDVIYCRDKHPRPEQGYEARVTDLRRAQILAQSLAGPRPVANGDLNCVVPRSISRPGRPHLLAICTTHHMNDGGYMLYLRREASGRLSASLAVETRRGPKDIAQLGCRNERGN